jgi:hypothetical protein
MFGNVTALEGLHATGKCRNRSMQHTCSRYAAWDPQRCSGTPRTSHLISEAGSCLRFIDSCVTQFKAQGYLVSLSSRLKDHPEVGACFGKRVCRGTSLTRKHNPLGPYRRPMSKALGGPMTLRNHPRKGVSG